MKFTLQSSYEPAGDQPEAIENLLKNLSHEVTEQVLIGVTGSGKTYTMANVIAACNRPTLVISHNKTLAAQLYQEFRDFFPDNAVSYFVSYYDYYLPESYIPQTDTFIEKETQINEDIDKLRLAATTNLLTRKDTIVIASVSSIYNIGSPREYGHFVLEMKVGTRVARKEILTRLVQLQYERSDYGFHRGTFRVRGETIDVFPAYEDTALRFVCDENKILSIEKINPLSGVKTISLESVVIYPAKHYMTNPESYKSVFKEIRADMEAQETYFKKQNKLIEAHRIRQRVEYDIEMIEEIGYVNGIENYSRYFDGRKPGTPPYTLFDYYKEATGISPHDWLLFIDESHMTIPQIRGMYNGDRSRKQTLVDYGFRLPSALDNRPMRFEEFLRVMPDTVYVSATPNDWELERANQSVRQRGLKTDGIVEQLVRPTGLIDPEISVRPSDNQIPDLITEIEKRVPLKERVLVTTLTKRMAEDLTTFLKNKGIKVQYLHSDIDTLERSEILTDLRKGQYDVIIGVNLLREGLDLPEVSLVAILDADKEGFLRSRTSLVQTMGRAARHISAQAILYANTRTRSINEAIREVTRRRNTQLQYNTKHGITPEGIIKPIREELIERSERERNNKQTTDTLEQIDISEDKINTLTPYDRKKLVSQLRVKMREASHDLRFEDAAMIRDAIDKLTPV